MNIKLLVTYDGTLFLGWQESIDGPTIEAALRQVLEKIYQEPLKLQAASRTDAGVHAEGQVANYHTEKHQDLSQLKISLNQMLPSSIRVLNVSQETDAFHPTLDVKGKEYHYCISSREIQPPFERHFAWHYPHPIKLDTIREASTLFLGTHDFSALCNTTIPRPKTTIRSLTRLEVFEEKGRLRFEVEGNHFLYKMVRNLVGTLIDVGSGKLSLDSVKGLLATRDRTGAGITAPAHGLCLKHVYYQASSDTRL